MAVVTARTAPAERTLADRLLAAVPLLSIFLWLSIVYMIQAWAHKTPWLFGDELELTQLSRAIANTGHAARRGEPYSFTTLWTYVLAPAWLIDNLHAAYATVKYLTVIVMAATVFPAYGIARLFVGRRPALFVAAASGAIPAVAYSSMIVEEPFAYFWSTLTLFLILRALITTSRWWIGGAVAASLIAPLVRGELAMLPALFALAGLFLIWRSDYVISVASELERAGTGSGFATLVVGAVIIVSAVLGHQSLEWNYTTRLYKGRMLDLSLNAAGALTIGLGVLPVVAGLAALWRAPDEPVSYALRVFRSVLLAAIIAFGVYTAVKATYVSISFGTYTYERNLIYLAPLLFAGTALWLERRRLHPIALAASSAFAFILILTTPYEMGQDLSYNAPGPRDPAAGESLPAVRSDRREDRTDRPARLLHRPPACTAFCRPRYKVARGRGCSGVSSRGTSPRRSPSRRRRTALPTVSRKTSVRRSPGWTMPQVERRRSTSASR